VSVIDLNTNAVTSITGFDNPIEIDSNSTGTRMYVTNKDGNSVSVIDTSTNSISETISDIAEPFGITFKNNFLYVAKTTGNLVFKIDLSTNEIVESIIVGSSPRFVGVNESGTFGYVTNLDSDSISVIKLTFESSTSTDWVGAQSISCPAPNPWVREKLGFAKNAKPVLVSAENTIGKTITQSSYDSLKSSGIVFDTVSTKVSTATETLPIYGCQDKLLSGKLNQPIQFIAGGYTLQSDAHGYINTADLKWHDTNGVTLYTNTAAFMHTIKFTKTGKYVVVLTEQPDTSRGLIPTYGVRSVRFVININ
jgi:YVTN family beta-propeller protein